MGSIGILIGVTFRLSCLMQFFFEANKPTTVIEVGDNRFPESVALTFRFSQHTWLFWSKNSNGSIVCDWSHRLLDMYEMISTKKTCLQYIENNIPRIFRAVLLDLNVPITWNHWKQPKQQLRWAPFFVETLQLWGPTTNRVGHSHPLSPKDLLFDQNNPCASCRN